MRYMVLALIAMFPVAGGIYFMHDSKMSHPASITSLRYEDRIPNDAWSRPIGNTFNATIAKK